MSSRQLRKLQQQRDLAQAQAKLQAEAEAEESEDEPIASAPKKGSLFANLAALQDEAEDEDEDVPEEQEVLSENPNPAPAPKSKKARKKKKAKRKHDKSVEEEKPMNGTDEIDTALRELNIKQSSRPSAPVQPELDPEYETICKLLSINSQRLKVANEMRNLFGREAVENNDDAGGRVGRQARRQQRAQNQQIDLETALKGRHAKGKGLSELTIRRNQFIQGKEEWPKGTTGGLTMAIVGPAEEDGTQEFKYEHDGSYQQQQMIFQAGVEMGDPQRLISFLIHNPYHISHLIQVSKIAKDQGDHALSSDLLERALFSFGRAATSAFNTKLSQGKARLNFARPENRELWLAGYHYIKTLIMKGTYGTALEWAKLLLSLKLNDPYCMRLMIHHLALRAREFQWLLDLKGSAMMRYWETIGHDRNPAIYHLSPSFALASLQLRDGVRCRELLSESMNQVPWLFFRLFKELDLDAPPSVWGMEPRTDAETLFTEIYVLQTKDLWNTTEATALLMEVAHTIPKVDLSKIPTVDNTEMTLDVVRSVYLDGKTQVMAMVPSSLLHRSNNSDADPLPPDQNVFSYDAQRLHIEGQPRGLGGDYNNPFAAMGNFIPDMPAALRNLFTGRRPEESADDFRTRMERGMEELRDSAESDQDVPADVLPQRRGFLQMLTDLFGGRGDEDEDDDEDSYDSATETDGDMPDLASLEGYPLEDEEDEDGYFSDEMPDTDDEMPDLVSNHGDEDHP